MAISDPILTMAEVADMFQRDVQTINGWRKAGNIHGFALLRGHGGQADRDFRFRLSEVERYIALIEADSQGEIT